MRSGNVAILNPTQALFNAVDAPSATISTARPGRWWPTDPRAKLVTARP
jgi:hypothetical protein